MASYTAEEIRLNSEPVRDAVYKNRIRLEGWIKLLCVIAFIGFAIFTYLLTSSNISNEETKTQINRLVLRQYELDMDVDRLNAQVEGLGLQQKRDALELSQKLVAATPIVKPAEPKYKVVVTDYKASAIGAGAYSLKMEARQDKSGFLSEEEAMNELERKFTQVRDVCTWGGYENASSKFALYLYAYKEAPIRPSCWQVLEAITGVKTSDRLTEGAISSLRDLVGVGEITTVFIQVDGRIIGEWRFNRPPTEKPCLEKAMRTIGWDGTGYFPVSMDDWEGPAARLIKGETLSLYFGPEIPDFCNGGNMIALATPPSWLQYEKLEGQHKMVTKYLAYAMDTRISWEESPWYGANIEKFKVTVDGKPLAAIGKGDLVKFYNGPKDPPIYASIDGPQITWYVAKANSNWGISAVSLAAMMDGVVGWRSLSTDIPSPYVIGEVVHYQGKPDDLTKSMQ